MKTSSKEGVLLPKPVPQRTCLGCRRVRPKREMIRIVFNAKSGVTVDNSGKSQGRGAYLCPQKACWELGLKKNHLEHALKTKVDAVTYQNLLEYSLTISGDDSVEN